MLQDSYLVRENFYALAETIRQEKRLRCEGFRVLAMDVEDGSYFVERIRQYEPQPDDFFWCIASELLNVGKFVEGYLLPSSGNLMPKLVVLHKNFDE